MKGKCPMNRIKKFLVGTKDYLLTSEDGSVIWLIQEIASFVKAMWKGIGERLNSIHASRDHRHDNDNIGDE